ncbi:MAG: alcohol dehydrogenase catalytic domain-containing protein, partial [Terriglobales bacterium]
MALGLESGGLTVKAIVVEKHGGPEVLQVQQAAEPTPGPGQARIKLAAAGVNFIDIYQRRGQYPIDLPYTPGQEGAGTVDMVGDGVTEVKVGDRVAYTSTPCSYAQYSVINADRLIPV